MHAARARLTLLALALALPACAPGIASREGLTLEPGMARIALVRYADTTLGSEGAQIAVNGVAVGTLGRGQRAAVDVPAGPVTVMASATAPGQWVLRFPAVPGGRYEVEVVPRAIAALPAAGFGTLGMLGEAAVNPEASGSFALSIVSAAPPLGRGAPAMGGPK
ncbi:hypothetical protein [Falsiroseomonas oryziterrae]|uniref:hypothetical protein n=1 Tax=Falsiroseomonas oryziterrae TaxID=2911368 RepID=UPI001F3495DD|nr:hypothetical protein [Roseomonas sp. NPKOSM-4]